MCRPNLYIQDVLEPLATLRMSLHDQIGQMKDNVPMGITVEILHHCLLPRIRHTLEELPEPLDEMYYAQANDNFVCAYTTVARPVSHGEGPLVCKSSTARGQACQGWSLGLSTSKMSEK